MRTDLGHHIRRRRIQARLSQQELADKIKVTTHSVSRYETGKRVPPIGILKRIAVATGCELVVELQKNIHAQL